MGNLPSYRVNGGRAFRHTGVDFGGPFFCRETLRRKAPTFKIYLCLFICMTTKAVHLEMVCSLSTQSFLAAFSRFTARRGLPAEVYSDCGTNFKGAASYLKEISRWYTSKETESAIADYSSKYEVKWNFNPPHAPHFGGLWESGIHSFKKTMKATIGETILTMEEFQTFMVQSEGILNSRPLCPLSSSPEETDYLSPGHFLIGDLIIKPQEPSLLDRKLNTLDRWQLVRRLSEQLWKKWRLTYLSNLQTRLKWNKQSRNLQIGDLVLLKDDNQPPLQWPTGKVIEITKGKDGIVRVAKVKTIKGEYLRPVVKLAPLLPVNT